MGVGDAEYQWPKVQCEDCYREFDYELLRVFQGAAREFMLCPACHRKYSEQRDRKGEYGHLRGTN